VVTEKHVMKWTKIFITTLQLNGNIIKKRYDGDFKGLKASKQKKKHQQDLAKFISTNHDDNKNTMVTNMKLYIFSKLLPKVKMFTKH